MLLENLGFKRNCFGKIEKPNLFIANRNYRKIDLLSSNTLIDLSPEFYLNGKSKLKFTYNRYSTNDIGELVENKCYSNLEEGNTILWDDVSWFVITCIEEDKVLEQKEVICSSCEEDFSNKLVTNVGNYNNIEDEDTSEEDVNLFSLYNPNDKRKSCLHIALEKLPNWSIGEVDTNINGIENKHTFSIDCTDAYSFLVNDVATSWDCLIIFDTKNKVVNAYRYDNPKICNYTSVYLSLQNLVSEYNLTTSSKLVSGYFVQGGNNGFLGIGNVDIADVNMNSNYLFNYTYLKDQFSESLLYNFNRYNSAYNTNKNLYATAQNQLTTLYQDYYTLIDKSPSVIGSTDWTQYGLNQLQTEYDANNLVISSYLELNSTTSLQQKEIAVSKKNAIESELIVRNKQIEAKLVEIQNKITQLSNLSVSLSDYLTDEDKKELSDLQIEVQYTNDTFCTYDTMSGDEVLVVKNDLLKNATDKLARECQPQFELDIKLKNLFSMEEFQDYADEITLGSVIRINYDKYLKDSSAVMEGRIIHISFNFDKMEDISVTLSNKSLLDSFCLEELRQQANTSTNYISNNNTSIKDSTSKTKMTKDFVQSNFNAMINKIRTNENDEVIINGSGIEIKKKLDNGYYDPRELRIFSGGLGITSTGWSGLGGGLDVAIGDLTLPDGRTGYGINARMLMSEIVISNELNIINDNLTFKVDTNGLSLTNNTNTILMNPNDKQLMQILKGTNKIFYIDIDGNLQITGKLTASSIYGSSIYGSEIVGGSLNINDKTIITSDGTLTCIDGIFEGTIKGSIIKGSTYYTENTDTGSAMRIYDGNIFIEGKNGYIRAIVGSNSFSKLIGISSDDNMVIGHDDAVSSIYGGKRININMYTDTLKIRQNSNGGTPTVLIGSNTAIHSGNIDNYLSQYISKLNLLEGQIGSLNSRVSALESKG